MLLCISNNYKVSLKTNSNWEKNNDSTNIPELWASNWSKREKF